MSRYKKRLYLSIVLFFGLASLSGSAQNIHRIDSLKNKLSSAKSDDRFSVLKNLFDETKAFNFNESLGYASKFYDLAVAKGDSTKMVEGGMMSAYSQIDLGKVENAVSTLMHVLGIAQRNQERLPDLKNRIKSILNNAGICYMQLGDFAKALDFHYQVLLIKEKEGDKRSIRKSLNNIGLVYYNIKDNENAIKYYLKAIAISTELNDFAGQELLFNNLGLCYSELGKPDKAIEAIERAFEICNKKCGDDVLKFLYQALGSVYKQKRDLAKAKEYLLKSLDIARREGDARYECENLLVIGEIEFELKNEQQGLASLKQSEAIAESIKTADARLSVYRELSKAYRHKKDYEQALAYQLKYSQLKDSIYNEQLIKNLTKVQTGFEERENLKALEEKNEVLALQQEVIDRQQKQFYLVTAIAVLVVILLLLSAYFRAKLKRKNNEILQNNLELHQLNLEKNNLIGIVAHDLKSPLGQIKGFLSLIQLTGKVDEESAKYLAMMNQSAQHLDQMITKILDVEAIESKKINVKLEAVDLSSVLKNVADRHENDATKKGIKINRQIDDAITVQADRSYIDQVMENLMSNAIKFSPFEKQIFITLNKENGHAIFEIRDEGPGLTEKDKKNLFGKYQKLSARPTGNESSTGLGLSIVKKFVDAMNGEIWCESEAGKGASFFLKLSLA